MDLKMLKIKCPKEINSYDVLESLYYKLLKYCPIGYKPYYIHKNIFTYENNTLTINVIIYN